MSWFNRSFPAVTISWPRNATLLSRPSLVADFAGLIPDDGVGIQPGLNVLAVCGLHAGRGLRQGGIAPYGHFLQLGQRHTGQRPRLWSRFGHLLRLAGRRHLRHTPVGHNDKLGPARHGRRFHILGRAKSRQKADQRNHHKALESHVPPPWVKKLIWRRYLRRPAHCVRQPADRNLFRLYQLCRQIGLCRVTRTVGCKDGLAGENGRLATCPS